MLKRLLRLALTGSTTVILAACYGPPMDQRDPYNLKEKHLTAKNSTGNPIPGLRVQLYENQNPLEQKQTDNNGKAFFAYYDTGAQYRLKVEDTDGPANGGEFLSQEIQVGEVEDYPVTLTEKTDGV
ncbi:MAG: hypothetical protein HZA20_11325 [Nitrospirae bacterium]|nr:hypothetical protein [Nitrospirota bacterium]